ncbi:MAG: ABC transporter ATP-binding protein [Cellulosilyticaceae bacterium]
METKESKLKTLARLFTYLKPFKWRTLGIIILLLIIMGTSTLYPYLMKICVDSFVGTKNVKGLLIIGGILILMTFTTMILSKIRIYEMSRITNSVLVNIRRELFTHLQTLGFKFFDSRPVGKILSRVVGDVNALQNLLNNSIANLIPNLFTVITVLVMMLTLNIPLTLICLIVLPALFGVMFFIEVRSNKMWHKHRELRSAMMGYTHEAFSGMKVVQAFANESYVNKRYKHHLDEHGDSFLHAVKFQDYFWPSVDLCRGIGMATILVAGYIFYKQGTLSIGTILAFILYIEMLWRPIINLSAFYNAFITNLSAAERIFEILDTQNDNDDDPAYITLPPLQGKIEFKNVTFSYDDDETHALKNVSFTINPGDKIALVGETGSGKTTITNLISKFYNPTQGQVLIDGIDLRHTNTHSLREQMGIMLQDSFLFSSSIKENILYGKLSATDEEITATAKAVNAHDFITALEEGYDTNVNERGSRLSQGQRQLIAFARALIADPKILILDEATANIDTQTERLVQQGIHKLMEGRTSIVIAHRLSTIRDCDKIFVLSHGKIVECGTHTDLLAQKGTYHNLYTAQYKFLEA